MLKAAGRISLVLASLIFLAACGKPAKQEILSKARGAETRAQLEDVLGKPDNIDKVGPLEKWTYEAADGTVTFILAGDSVTTSVTGDKPAE